MKRKRPINRPTLARVEPNETALIWNPKYGFRLAVPRNKGRSCKVSVEELFLGALLHKTADEDYIQQVTANHFGHFTKH